MHKKIVVSFSLQTGKEQRVLITERINTALTPINKEINGWNGFVDYVEAGPGYFVFIAKCDNEEIREMMQILIDEEMSNPKRHSIDNGTSNIDNHQNRASTKNQLP